jgi:hypothetical protein
MLEIFGMWIPYIENHIPTKIYAYLNHNMEAYLLGQNCIASGLVKFNKTQLGLYCIERPYGHVFKTYFYPKYLFKYGF